MDILVTLFSIKILITDLTSTDVRMDLSYLYAAVLIQQHTNLTNPLLHHQAAKGGENL